MVKEPEDALLEKKETINYIRCVANTVYGKKDRNL
jgi:hypothetical protein